jgi:hypothetical protein
MLGRLIRGLSVVEMPASQVAQIVVERQEQAKGNLMAMLVRPRRHRPVDASGAHGRGDGKSAPLTKR